MPVSAIDSQARDRQLAIAAESLYLVNLMLLPGLAFVVLCLLQLGPGREAGPLARNHLSQTIGISALGGALIVSVCLLLFLLGGFGPWTWVWVIFYFTFVHSSLIFMGVFGFIKAMNNQHFSYPLLGRWFAQ